MRRMAGFVGPDNEPASCAHSGQMTGLAERVPKVCYTDGCVIQMLVVYQQFYIQDRGSNNTQFCSVTCRHWQDSNHSPFEKKSAKRHQNKNPTARLPPTYWNNLKSFVFKAENHWWTAFADRWNMMQIKSGHGCSNLSICTCVHVGPSGNLNKCPPSCLLLIQWLTFKLWLAESKSPSKKSIDYAFMSISH